MQNNYSSQNIEYAGFWVRLAAYCIDSVIVFIALLTVRIGFALAGGTLFSADILFHYTLKDIVLYFLQALYFILCTYLTGTTPGKRLMNLRVICAGESEKLTLLNVVFRETVGRFLCRMTVGIGYIAAGLDGEKRGLHDLICDTRVIYGKKVKIFPVYQVPPGRMPSPYGSGRGTASAGLASAQRADFTAPPESREDLERESVSSADDK